jgi:hypothetical protein
MSPLYIAKSSQIAARNLGGEMMIMSALDSTLFSLNDVGTVIWEAADGHSSLEEIVERKVCAEFEVEPAEALKDAEGFVRELAEHGILVVSYQPVLDIPKVQGPGLAQPKADPRVGPISHIVSNAPRATNQEPGTTDQGPRTKK